MDRYLYQKEKPFGTRILLSPLYLLSLLYGGVLRGRHAFYARRIFQTVRLPVPVISVGNITAGGTGKTPLVMALAEALRERGIPVAILSRGYQGKGGCGAVVADGEKTLLTVEEAGDEPFLMAKRLSGIPVLIGKDRTVTGRIALQKFSVRGLLLDDGFQHLRLHRDLNMVLIDATVGFGDGSLLPRGILREPLDHLLRADLFVLTKMEPFQTVPPLEDLLREIHPRAPVFHSHLVPTGLIGPSGERERQDVFKGKKVVALSGIANPSPFSILLKNCGMEVIKEVTFPDHYRYTREDLFRIESLEKTAEGIITTEKDLVKLADLGIGHLRIWALRIELRIWEEAFYHRVFRLFGHEGAVGRKKEGFR